MDENVQDIVLHMLSVKLSLISKLYNMSIVSPHVRIRFMPSKFKVGA